MPDPLNPQNDPGTNAADAVPSSASWQVAVQEQRRQGREQELWSIPAISIAAQAFLFTTGLAADTSPAARIVLAGIGLLTAIGTLLAVLRQATRVGIAEDWMQEIQGAESLWTLRNQLYENRRKRNEPERSSLLDHVPHWIFGPDEHFQLTNGHIWTIVLAAFAVADVLVILSSVGGLHVLHLAK